MEHYSYITTIAVVVVALGKADVLSRFKNQVRHI